MGAWIVFADESGFLLIPSVCRTWAPRGQTPYLKHRYRHDRLSVHSAIAVSPVRQRLRLFYRWQDTNIRAADAADFIRQVLCHLRGTVFVIWDNASIHRGTTFVAFIKRHPRLHLIPLPAYAPELNPDEGVWQASKRRLANSFPNDLSALGVALEEALESIAHSPTALRACITQSDLPPFLR